MDLISAFAEAVGGVGAGPVSCVGGRTQWSVGGRLADGVREVSAPAGVVAHEPGEMIVRVRAATTLAQLSRVTAEAGQLVALESDDDERATVGGVLACGRSGVRRLGWGPLRDCVLEVKAVTATGEVIRAGAPLVKNVTGFDLCRLLVGSVGTLAFLAEVVLRCQPRPEVESWWATDPGTGVDPFAVRDDLYRPLAVLWDGDRAWVGLAGRRVDVAAQVGAVLSPAGFRAVDGPPTRPGSRFSLPPGELRDLPARTGRPGTWLAEVGVGLVHGAPGSLAGWRPEPPPQPIADLHRRLKDRFDPTGRLNPGRSPLNADASEEVGSGDRA